MTQMDHDNRLHISWYFAVGRGHLTANGIESFRPVGETHYANSHHRHDGSRNPMLIAGVRTAAKPRLSVDPEFLGSVGAPVVPQFRAASLRAGPSGGRCGRCVHPRFATAGRTGDWVQALGLALPDPPDEATDTARRTRRGNQCW
jgi:hypothetical protein